MTLPNDDELRDHVMSQIIKYVYAASAVSIVSQLKNLAELSDIQPLSCDTV